MDLVVSNSAGYPLTQAIVRISNAAHRSRQRALDRLGSLSSESGGLAIGDTHPRRANGKLDRQRRRACPATPNPVPPVTRPSWPAGPPSQRARRHSSAPTSFPPPSPRPISPHRASPKYGIPPGAHHRGHSGCPLVRRCRSRPVHHEFRLRGYSSRTREPGHRGSRCKLVRHYAVHPGGGWRSMTDSMKPA